MLFDNGKNKDISFDGLSLWGPGLENNSEVHETTNDVV